MKIGLFPGQGLPPRRIAAAIPNDHPLLVRSIELLGYNLRDRVTAASISRAPLPTDLVQPATYLAGVIAYRAARDAGTGFAALAGHSMGEYTALAAAEAVSFEDGLALVRTRGEAMLRAARRRPGGMVALISVPWLRAADIAATSDLEIANHNSIDQVVLAGDEEGLAQASRLAAESGGRAVLLAVGGAFHTDRMRPARDALRAGLERVVIRRPLVPVISNVVARPYADEEEIRDLLLEQLTSPVLFRQSMEWAWRRGMREAIDLGPGDVVGALARRTFASMEREHADV